MAKGLAVTGDLQAAAQQIKGLYKLFDACDCTMVEVGCAPGCVRCPAMLLLRAMLCVWVHALLSRLRVLQPSKAHAWQRSDARPSHPARHPWSLCCVQVNPLAEDTQGRLIAADAKLGFDDSSSYRQQEVFAMKDESQLDARCARACLLAWRAGRGAGRVPVHVWHAAASCPLHHANACTAHSRGTPPGTRIAMQGGGCRQV
jgi:hypothetical protein